MEEQTAKDLVYEEIRLIVIRLKEAKQTEKRAELMEELSRLSAIYGKLESIDLERVEKDRRFKEEIRQKDLDRDYRDMLERDRMRMEMERDSLDRELREKIEKEKLSQERKFGLRDIVVRSAGIVIPSTISALFLALGMKLEFLDNGSVTSFAVKELFKKAIAPKIA